MISRRQRRKSNVNSSIGMQCTYTHGTTNNNKRSTGMEIISSEAFVDKLQNGCLTQFDSWEIDCRLRACIVNIARISSSEARKDQRTIAKGNIRSLFVVILAVDEMCSTFRIKCSWKHFVRYLC